MQAAQDRVFGAFQAGNLRLPPQDGGTFKGLLHTSMTVAWLRLAHLLVSGRMSICANSCPKCCDRPDGMSKAIRRFPKLPFVHIPQTDTGLGICSKSIREGTNSYYGAPVGTWLIFE